MNKIYWRVSYKGIGIYEALKKEIWNISESPKMDWDNIKNSKAFMWLKTPDAYSKNSSSYFTKLGYSFFVENTYPILIKYLDEKSIFTEKFIFDDTKINIVYSDEHQIVVEQ